MGGFRRGMVACRGTRQAAASTAARQCVGLPAGKRQRARLANMVTPFAGAAKPPHPISLPLLAVTSRGKFKGADMRENSRWEGGCGVDQAPSFHHPSNESRWKPANLIHANEMPRREAPEHTRLHFESKSRATGPSQEGRTITRGRSPCRPRHRPSPRHHPPTRHAKFPPKQ